MSSLGLLAGTQQLATSPRSSVHHSRVGTNEEPGSCCFPAALTAAPLKSPTVGVIYNIRDRKGLVSILWRLPEGMLTHLAFHEGLLWIVIDHSFSSKGNSTSKDGCA